MRARICVLKWVLITSVLVKHVPTSRNQLLHVVLDYLFFLLLDGFSLDISDVSFIVFKCTI